MRISFRPGRIALAWTLLSQAGSAGALPVFWIGAWNDMYRYDTAGSLLGSLEIPAPSTVHAIVAVPEPSTALLLGLGFSGMATVRRTRSGCRGDQAYCHHSRPSVLCIRCGVVQLRAHHRLRTTPRSALCQIPRAERFPLITQVPSPGRAGSHR